MAEELERLGTNSERKEQKLTLLGQKHLFCRPSDRLVYLPKAAHKGHTD